MAQELKLYKKLVPYTDKKTNEEKTATNFYVMCGDRLIAIEVTNFSTQTKPDKDYLSRKSVMSAFAELPPELPDSGKKKPAKPKDSPAPAAQS